MQAVIPAAGNSSRMRPASKNVHKALLSVGNKVILERMVDELLAVGVTEITMVTGGDSEEQLRQFLLRRYTSVPFRFVHNHRYADTDNIVSLWMAFEQMKRDGALNQDVLLVEYDIVIDHKVLPRLMQHPSPNVALVEQYRTGMDGTVVTLTDGRISDFIHKKRQHRAFDYSDTYKTLNIYRFTGPYVENVLCPSLKEFAEHDPKLQYEEVFSHLSENPATQIAAAVVDGEKWIEVDDPNDLRAARFQFDPERRADIIQATRGGNWNFDMLDYAMIRNAYFPTEPMLAMMRHAFADIIESYGSTQMVLNQKLSYVLGCDENHLQVLHGATQAYPWLRNLWHGRTVAIPEPTFGEYSRMFPLAYHYSDVPGNGWGQLDNIANRVDVCIIVNPNNPSGHYVPAASLHKLAQRHPGTTFLVDESFQVFTGEECLLTLLETEPLHNVIILTSLSKSLGAPGLRLGYLYSTNAAFIEAIGGEIPIWNLSAPAEYMLELLLKFRKDLIRSYEHTIADRQAMAADLQTVPLIEEVYPSGGNFILVGLRGHDASLAAQLRHILLAELNIDTKDVSDRYPDGKPRMRLAVRCAADNAKLVDAISSVSHHPQLANIADLTRRP